MSQSRQLAAIMFTDIVGYTVLMGKDSTKALELVRILIIYTQPSSFQMTKITHTEQ